MICVGLVGNLDDNSIGDFLYQKLSNFFTVTYLSNNKILKNGVGNDFLLFDIDNISSCNFENCILIIKKASNINLINSLDQTTVAIVSSDEQEYLKKLSKLNIKTITCGSLSKDTVTFSSKNDDEIVISLQRTINSIFSEEIEPFEIPIKKSQDDDDFTILAYIVLCVEIGVIDKNWH